MNSGVLLGRSGGITILLLLGVTAALAQPTVTAISPAPNLRNAPRTSPVTVTFSQPLDAASTTGLKVFGAQRGGLRTGRTGTATVSGNTLTFTPSYPYQAGETVHATLTTAARNASGQPLAQSRVFDFVAAATGGTGAFGAGSDVAVGYVGLSDLTMVDLDNDGDLDLLQYEGSRYSGSASQGSGIYRYLNDGTGTFTRLSAAVDSPDLGTSFSSIATADLDGDGDLDVAYGKNGGAGFGLNDGNGNFTAGGGSILNGVSQGVPHTARVALVDVDGDGDQDLITQFPGFKLDVLFNNGTGAFSNGITVAGGSVGSGAVVPADVDNDGDMDLLSPDYPNTKVLLNNGQGVFSLGGTVAAAVVGLSAGDIDGDNDVDFVALDNATYNVVVGVNNGTGGFATTTIPGTGGLGKANLADVDADGDLDILATSSLGVIVLLNDGSGTFTPGTTLALAAQGPAALTAGDIDQDGDLDLITATIPASGTGASSSLNIRLNQNRPLATQPSALAAQVSIFPNPAHQRFAVNLPAVPGAAAATLTLRNAVGQLVLRQLVPLQPAGTRAEFDAGGCRPGLYLLGVRAGTETFTKRLMLE
ncbi:FG-GAP-like repeat-containing protein [Hymenobacter terricola]|uniref:FG-GAP-like repeat-containing protein n=1 Tax=Hymenobacter terricola TaxID=2819236 RepID=UPI001B300BC5|nr:FG-GAP-like repeat-containing protein [Hymenobacter terricola]